MGINKDFSAGNLANKLNVKVYAPTDYLWSYPNGKYFVAGMLKDKDRIIPNMEKLAGFKLFVPGGNK